MDYQGSTGRFSEVIFGIITFLISLIFFGIIFLVATNASLSLGSIGGSIALGLTGFWFAQIAYRLTFRKHRKTGGLISPLAIKFWCVVFGIFSLVFMIFGFFEADINAVFSAAVMLPACWYGWKLAEKRQRRNDA